MAKTKEERAADAAYQAGRAAISEPPERRTVEACPFPEGDPQRESWLAGFSDAIDEQPDVSSLKKAVREAKA